MIKHLVIALLSRGLGARNVQSLVQPQWESNLDLRNARPALSHVAQSVEGRASIPEVVGSIPTVVGQNFQPAQCGFCPE